MPHWPIRNVMTTDVITASDHALVAEVANLLAERRISAVPIVNQFDVVVGVVSWTDLLRAIEPAEQDDTARGGWLRRSRPGEVRWPIWPAAKVMSAPPVTVGPDASLSTAFSTRRASSHRVGDGDRDGWSTGCLSPRLTRSPTSPHPAAEMNAPHDGLPGPAGPA